jgi:hypothetical protein
MTNDIYAELKSAEEKYMAEVLSQTPEERMMVYKEKFPNVIYWNKEDDGRTPYVYFQISKVTGLKNYGVKYGEGCHPDGFYDYFSSSAKIHALVEEHGKGSIDWDIRRTFQEFQFPYNIFEACLMENAIQRHFDVLSKDDWANEHVALSTDWGCTDEILEKIKQTFLENYKDADGEPVIHPMRDPKIVEKLRQTNLGKYTDEDGNPVDNPAKDPEIKESKRQTNLEKYTDEDGNPVDHQMLDPKVKEKRTETILKKYTDENGNPVTSPMQDPKVIEKTKQTNLSKYKDENGNPVTSPMQDPRVVKKLKETQRKRYGWGK